MQTTKSSNVRRYTREFSPTRFQKFLYTMFRKTLLLILVYIILVILVTKIPEDL